MGFKDTLNEKAYNWNRKSEEAYVWKTPIEIKSLKSLKLKKEMEFKDYHNWNLASKEIQDWILKSKDTSKFGDNWLIFFVFDVQGLKIRVQIDPQWKFKCK